MEEDSQLGLVNGKAVLRISIFDDGEIDMAIEILHTLPSLKTSPETSTLVKSLKTN